MSNVGVGLEMRRPRRASPYGASPEEGIGAAFLNTETGEMETADGVPARAVAPVVVNPHSRHARNPAVPINDEQRRLTEALQRGQEATLARRRQFERLQRDMEQDGRLVMGDDYGGLVKPNAYGTEARLAPGSGVVARPALTMGIGRSLNDMRAGDAPTLPHGWGIRPPALGMGTRRARAIEEQDRRRGLDMADFEREYGAKAASEEARRRYEAERDRARADEARAIEAERERQRNARHDRPQAQNPRPPGLARPNANDLEKEREAEDAADLARVAAAEEEAQPFTVTDDEEVEAGLRDAVPGRSVTRKAQVRRQDEALKRRAKANEDEEKARTKAEEKAAAAAAKATEREKARLERKREREKAAGERRATHAASVRVRAQQLAAQDFHDWLGDPLGGALDSIASRSADDPAEQAAAKQRIEAKRKELEQAAIAVVENEFATSEAARIRAEEDADRDYEEGLKRLEEEQARPKGPPGTKKGKAPAAKKTATKLKTTRVRPPGFPAASAMAPPDLSALPGRGDVGPQIEATGQAPEIALEVGPMSTQERRASAVRALDRSDVPADTSSNREAVVKAKAMPNLPAKPRPGEVGSAAPGAFAGVPVSQPAAAGLLPSAQIDGGAQVVAPRSPTQVAIDRLKAKHPAAAQVALNEMLADPEKFRAMGVDDQAVLAAFGVPTLRSGS